MAAPATVAILSIGDMGLGFGRLLVAHSFRVVTNVAGRSADTVSRCKLASIETLASDTELVSEADYVLSIVPPRDSVEIARRISSATRNTARTQPNPLYFLDLNAISPLTAEKVAAEFSGLSDAVKVLDGGIIGGPPHPKEPAQNQTTDYSPYTESDGGVQELSSAAVAQSWYRPSVMVAGPDTLSGAPVSGANLAQLLNVKHIDDRIGPASGLKMCFAGINKGLTAIGTQSASTAQQLGVLPHLQDLLKEHTNGMDVILGRGVPNMCPKSYRWVAEMDEIAETMRECGGWRGRTVDGMRQDGGNAKQGDLFGAISEIYRFVADESVLGQEKVGKRERGKTLEDVARILSHDLNENKS